MTKVGSILEFASDETEETGIEQTEESSVQATAEEVVEETATPSEPAAAEEESSEQPAGEPSEDVAKPDKELLGLRDERDKLIKELVTLRGAKRDLKQEELIKVEQKIDDLQDVNPEDVALIEKVLKTKGYVRKDEVEQTFYQRIENQERDAFLAKYPEYKPENDPNDLNWNTLMREFGLYARPKDPKMVGDLLERAHKAVVKPSSDRSIEVKKQVVKTASVGAGGTQRSSSNNSFKFDAETRVSLLNGGFTEEDIAKMEARKRK